MNRFGVSTRRFPLPALAFALAFAAALLAARASAFAAVTDAKAAWEYAPYRIEVLTAALNPADLNTADAARLHERLQKLSAAYVGAPWTLNARSALGLLRAEMLTRFDDLSVEIVREALPDEVDADKLMLVLLSRDAGGWQIAVRELDLRTFHISPVIRVSDVAHSALAEQLLAALVSAFSPTARLGPADRNTVRGQLQAAQLAIDADSPVLVAPGEALLPFLRRNDRLGHAQPHDVQAIPWTVLELQQRDAAAIECRVHSAHVNPLGGKSRLRLVRYAQATRYPPRTVQLALQTPGDDPAPLVGYELVRRDGQTGRVVVLGETDAAGIATLPPAEEAWRLLYVRHGDRLLARLPIIRGARGRYDVPLHSDDARLAAAGFAAALRQEIIDTLARRQLLATRIHRRIAEGRLDDAQTLLDEFRRLDSARQFQQRLADARRELFADNARSQQLIDQMFAEIRDAAARYLDPDEPSALETELSQARAAG